MNPVFVKLSSGTWVNARRVDSVGESDSGCWVRVGKDGYPHDQSAEATVQMLIQAVEGAT